MYIYVQSNTCMYNARKRLFLDDFLLQSNMDEMEPRSITCIFRTCKFGTAFSLLWSNVHEEVLKVNRGQSPDLDMTGNDLGHFNT